MKKIFLIIIFLLSQVSLVFSDVKIVFVDMERIMSTSKPGLSILKQLKDLNDINQKLFIGQQEKLKQKEDEIISKKNIISKKDYQIAIDMLKKNINEYNKDRNEKITNFNKLKIENTNKFLQLISPILTKHSEKNSISMILQKKKLIMGKTELDITNEIINFVNNEIKEFKIK